MVIKLEELKLNIFGGQIIQRNIVDENSGESAVDAKRGTIVSKTISEGEIIDENIVYNDYKVMSDERRYTVAGDIVLKMAAPYNAVIIDKEHEGLLVSSFCSIIRNIDESKINKEYLVAFLNSDYCQKQLEQKVFGATTMSILSNGKLQEVMIPMPPMDEQIRIGQFFLKAINTRTIIKKIIKLEEEKLSAMIESWEK